MMRSGSAALAAVRQGMWGFLLFAGVAWLAIAWTVMRLEPANVAAVAGPVLLFGALTEAVRALAATRTWWLHAGMAALFAVTAVVVLASGDSTYATPAALVGWYLMVRGAADVAISMLTRETDRIWGLLMVVGVLETGLGFCAASPWWRTGDLVLTALGGLALLRGVADLVAALRLREESAAPAGVLDLPPERAAGLAGYAAGRTDYESAPVRTGPRHRASSKGVAGRAATPSATFHDEVLRASADLDSMLALAGMTGAAVGAALADTEDIPAVPDTPEGVELPWADGDDPEPVAAPQPEAPAAG
jgi:uncharacterized membrane protein HdeD (DUF308 family)